MGIETLVAPYRRKLESLYTDNAASNHEIEGEMLETLKLNFIHLGHIQGEIVGALSTEINTHYYSHPWPIDEQWHVLTFWLDDNNYKWNLDVLGAIPFTEGQKFEGIAIDLVKKFVEPTAEGHSQARYKQIVDFWQEKSGRPPEPSKQIQGQNQNEATLEREKDLSTANDALFTAEEIEAIETHLKQIAEVFPAGDGKILYSRLDSLLFELTGVCAPERTNKELGAINSIKVLRRMNHEKRIFVARELYLWLFWLVDLNEKATELAQMTWQYLGMKVIDGGWDFWKEVDAMINNIDDVTFRLNLKPDAPFRPFATAPLMVDRQRLSEIDDDGQMILWLRCQDPRLTLVLRCSRAGNDLRFIAESADKQIQFPALIKTAQPTALQILQYLSGSPEGSEIRSIHQGSPLGWLFGCEFALQNGCSPEIVNSEVNAAGTVTSLQFALPAKGSGEHGFFKLRQGKNEVVSFSMSSNYHMHSRNFIELLDGTLTNL